MAWSSRLRKRAAQLRRIEIRRVNTARTIGAIVPEIGGRKEPEVRWRSGLPSGYDWERRSERAAAESTPRQDLRTQNGHYLQVVGRKSCPVGDACEHTRSDLVAIVERPDEAGGASRSSSLCEPFASRFVARQRLTRRRRSRSGRSRGHAVLRHGRGDRPGREEPKPGRGRGPADLAIRCHAILRNRS